MIRKNSTTAENLLEKARRYCNYQERSHFEVREKLYSLGAHKADVELTITQLIADGDLDEERFASSFARGKFRLKHWGRIKIRQALKLKRVSDYNIKTALRQIDENEYVSTLTRLAGKKWDELFGETTLISRQAKTRAYLLQKGFESPLVSDAVRRLDSHRG